MNNIVDSIRGMNPYSESYGSTLKERGAHTGWNACCDAFAQQLSSIQSAGVWRNFNEKEPAYGFNIVKNSIDLPISDAYRSTIDVYQMGHYKSINAVWLDPATSTDTGSDWVSVEAVPPEPEDNHLWCKVPVNEPYYFGSMLETDFPQNYYTHYLPFAKLPNPPNTTNHANT